MIPVSGQSSNDWGVTERTSAATVSMNTLTPSAFLRAFSTDGTSLSDPKSVGCCPDDEKVAEVQPTRQASKSHGEF